MSCNDAQLRLRDAGLGLAQFLLLLTLICMLVPLAPGMPQAGLDASWALGVNHAVAQGMALGTDMVFSSGPYAAVFTNSYHPTTDTMAMCSGFVLALSAWFALWVLTRRAGFRSLAPLFLALWLLSYSRDALFFAIAAMSGMACQMICLQMPRDDEAAPRLLILVALLTIPLGLLPLVKGSFIILCLLVVAFAGWTALWQGHIRIFLILLLGPVLTIGVSWVLSGQHLGGLSHYFGSMLPIIFGYTAAMSHHGFLPEVWLFLMLSAAFLWILYDREKSMLSGQWMLFAALLFLAFKAGYVRHDSHALTASIFLCFAVAMGSIALVGQTAGGVLPRTILGLAFLFVIATVTLYSSKGIKAEMDKVSGTSRTEADAFKLLPRSQQASLAVQKLGLERLGKLVWMSIRISNPYEALSQGWAVRVMHPMALPLAYADSLARIRQSLPIPILDGTVDIYSFNQSAVVASGNHWQPRPVPQSYSVYTPALAQLNAMHLRGARGADDLFFRVEPIDGRWPAMEDGLSWPVMLDRYFSVRYDNDLLHLKKRPAKTEEQAVALERPMTAFHQQQASMGQRVDVPDAASPGHAIYITLDIQLTSRGKLFNLLYQPHPLLITFTLKDGGTRQYRLVPGMVVTPVMLSPMIENTAQMANLFGLKAASIGQQVKDFRVDEFGGQSHWISDVEIVFLSSPLHQSTMVESTDRYPR